MPDDKRPAWMTPMAYNDGSGPSNVPIETDPEDNDDFYARGPKDEITGDTEGGDDDDNDDDDFDDA